MKLYNKTKDKLLRKILSLCCALPILLFASCGDNVDLEAKEAAEDGMVSVRVAVEDIARTAFPQLNLEDFISFKLNRNDVLVKTWSKDAQKGYNAYQVMNQDMLTLTAGTYTFELIGTEKSGATYKGVLKDKAVTTSTVLNFTLSLNAISYEGKGDMRINVTYPARGVQKLVVRRYASSDEKAYMTTFPVTERTETDLSGTYSYSEFVPAGIYIVTFTFYGGDGIELATVPEYVYVSSGCMSESTVKIDAMDDIYRIIYLNVDDAAFTTKPLYYSWQSDITLPIPNRTGYIFTGWFLADESGKCTDTEITSWKGTERTGNVRAYATWDKEIYDVEFDTVADGVTVEDQGVSYEDLVERPDDPERENFTFDDWYTDKTYTTKFDFDSTIISGNTTIFARWRYDISFDKNADAAEGEMTTITVYEDGATTQKLIKNIFTNSGYTFLGWATDKTATTATYADCAEIPAKFSAEGNTTLYAVWKADSEEAFTVTFDVCGGSGVVAQVVDKGKLVAEPAEPVKDGYAFVGWYTSTDDGATLSDEAYEFGKNGIHANLTLYAKWVQTTYYVSAEGSDTDDGTKEKPLAKLTNALAAIKNDGYAEFDYTVVVSGKIVGNTTVSPDWNDTAKSITITGATGNETDILDGNAIGSVLTIQTSVPLTLRKIKVTNGLRPGYTNNYGAGITQDRTLAKLTLDDGALITGNAGGSSSCAGGLALCGTLVINEGAEISNNTGGGLYLYSATVTMNGGKITGNAGGAQGGGGVYLKNTTFVMNDGEISGNTNTWGAGGGVYIFSGEFTMNDGKICGNKVTYTSYGTYGGGGVAIKDGTGEFTMNGGEISNNSTKKNGGGVYTSGKFTMNAGNITGNEAESNGGGVCNYGTITILDGTIADNTAADGAGLYTNHGTVTITDGEISGNTAAGEGGGIYNYYTNIYMNGGTISGNTAGEGGGAVYNLGHQSAHFYISGAAYIPAGEDGKNTVAYGDTASIIVVKDELTAPVPVATFMIDKNLFNYPCEPGTPVIKADDENVTMDATLAAKFALSAAAGEPWYIDENGNIATETYKVIYKDLGGGEFSGTFPDGKEETHTFGKATTLYEPKKDGYVFMGWYVGWYKDGNTGAIMPEGGVMKEIGAKAYTSDVTVFARWVKESSTVTVEEVTDIAIAKKDNGDGTVTLTATKGFTGYTWTVDGEAVTETSDIWTIGDEGASLTYTKAKLLSEYVYVVKVWATNSDGVLCEKTLAITE